MRAVVVALLMAITPIFCCGAECGIVSAGAAGGVLHWNTVNGGATVTADTVTFHSPGIRAYKFSPAGAVCNIRKTLASPTVGVMRCYLRFNTLPSASTNLMAFITAGSFAFFNYNQTTNKFRVAVTGNGATGADVGPTLNANQWYRVDFRADVSANPWKLDTKIDGSTETQFTNAIAATTFSAFAIGGLIDTSIGTPTLTVYADDIILSTTGADWPIGTGGIVGLSPTQDGTHVFNATTDFKYDTAGAGVAVGATDTWNHVKVVPLTQITTCMSVTGAANTEYLEWQFAATPTDVSTINGIEVVASNFSASTSASKQTLRVNDGGTTNDVYTDLSAAHTTIGYSTKQYATAPTGGTWTKAKVDALRARWNSSFGTVDESPVPSVAGVMLEVDYVAQATNPTATDTLTVAEATTLDAQLTPTETATVSEAWSTTLDARATDTLTVSEAASASQGAGSQVGTGSDSAALAESARIATVLTAADSLAVADSPSITSGLTAADSATLSESARATLTTVAADGATLTESWRGTLAVSVADGPSLSESASASQGAGSQIAVASDTLTVTERALANLSAAGADSVVVSEAASAGLGGLASDALTVSEFAQGVSGQQMNGEAMLTDITFTPRLQASETTIADVQGEETLT